MSLGMAVIGLGRWGPNYVRILEAMQDVDLLAAADLDVERHKRLEANYPSVDFVADYRDILARDDVNAVIIAVPTAAHHEVVCAALSAGKHVLCEKPLAASSKEAWEMVALAEQGGFREADSSQEDQEDRKGLVLMTGHIFLFNPGIEYLRDAASDAKTGRQFYINAVRTNLGPFRSDVNAAWDLASHDIYIFNHVMGQRPDAVSAVGASYLRQPVEDIAFLTLRYPNGAMGHIHISWLDPKKVRQITLVCEKRMITWDEFGMPGPIMIYDRAVTKEPVYETFGEFQLLTREGDVTVPRIQSREPLSAQAAEFISRCKGESDDLTKGSAKQGAEVVDILEASSQSLKEDGRFVSIEYGDATKQDD